MRDYLMAFLVMLTLLVAVLFVGSPSSDGIHWPGVQRSASNAR